MPIGPHALVAACDPEGLLHRAAGLLQDLASAGSFFASVARWLVLPDYAESVKDQDDNEYERGSDREHDLHRRFPYRERNLNNGSPKPGFRKRDEPSQKETAPDCSRRGKDAEGVNPPTESGSEARCFVSSTG